MRRLLPLLAMWACHPDPPSEPEFLRREADLYQADPVVGHVHRPWARRAYEWEEHPRGHFDLATNNHGFREDADTPGSPAPGVRRVLVVGDSQVDGVVDNADAFPNRIEAMLAAEGRTVEVINGGTGYYGPAQYAGFLERHLALAPDAFVVVLYAGNDWVDAVYHLESSGSLDIARDEAHFERLQRAVDILGEGVSQQLNQDVIFARNPDLLERAFLETETALARVRTTCASRGMAFAVVVLPPFSDVEPGALEPAWSEALGILGLTPQQVGVHRGLDARLVAAVTAWGVPVVDLTTPLSTAALEKESSLYWRRDHHLNVRGHQAVATVLHARIPEIWLGKTASNAPSP